MRMGMLREFRVGEMAGSLGKRLGGVAQVRKKGGDLHRESGSYALQWRRSPAQNPTCAQNGAYLRQEGQIVHL